MEEKHQVLGYDTSFCQPSSGLTLQLCRQRLNLCPMSAVQIWFDLDLGTHLSMWGSMDALICISCCAIPRIL